VALLTVAERGPRAYTAFLLNELAALVMIAWPPLQHFLE
jgi:hypothetical protein